MLGFSCKLRECSCAAAFGAALCRDCTCDKELSLSGKDRLSAPSSQREMLAILNCARKRLGWGW